VSEYIKAKNLVPKKPSRRFTKKRRPAKKINTRSSSQEEDARGGDDYDPTKEVEVDSSY